MDPLAYKEMEFEEFCAAAISVYQLEAHGEWDTIASRAFEYFEQEGNRPISVEELALVCACVFGCIQVLLVRMIKHGLTRYPKTICRK